MTNSLLHRWIFEIPLHDVKSTEKDTTTMACCFLCGKPVKDLRKAAQVHYLTSGSLVSSDQPFDNSQGFFPIGNECKKKLPNNFIF